MVNRPALGGFGGSLNFFVLSFPGRAVGPPPFGNERWLFALAGCFWPFEACYFFYKSLLFLLPRVRLSGTLHDFLLGFFLSQKIGRWR